MTRIFPFASSSSAQRPQGRDVIADMLQHVEQADEPESLARREEQSVRKVPGMHGNSQVPGDPIPRRFIGLYPGNLPKPLSIGRLPPIPQPTSRMFRGSGTSNDRMMVSRILLRATNHQ